MKIVEDARTIIHNTTQIDFGIRNHSIINKLLVNNFFEQKQLQSKLPINYCNLKSCERPNKRSIEPYFCLNFIINFIRR